MLGETAPVRFPWQTKRPIELPPQLSPPPPPSPLAAPPQELQSSNNHLPETSDDDSAAAQDRSSVNETTGHNVDAKKEAKTDNPSLNDDLEQLERALVGMERYVESLQFEMLKLHQREEAKELDAQKPPLPFAEFVTDLDRIAHTLEVHKTDYTLVTEIQTENASLRKTLLKRTTEVEVLRAELDAVKRAHSAEIEALKQEHDKKVEELQKNFEEKLKKLSDELNAKLEQERAEFCSQRDAWNEERASLLVQQASEMAQMIKSKEAETAEDESDFKTEIMKQISEMQNQAREQVAQLQSRIEQLMTVRTPTRTPRSSGGGGGGGGRIRASSSSAAVASIRSNPPQPPTPAPPPLLAPKWPLPQPVVQQQTPLQLSVVKNSVFQRPVGRNTPSCQSIGSFTSNHDCPPPIGQKRPYTGLPVTSVNENTPQACAKPPFAAALPANRKLPPKVAAVPPVLVMAEEPHPLLGEKSPEDSKEETKGIPAASYVELPHSRWTKASDVIQRQQQQQQQQHCEPSYFQLPCSSTPDVSFMQSGGGEWFDCYPDDPSQFSVCEPPSQSMDDCPSTCMPLPTPPHPPQQQRKRHLFTVHSGNN